MDYEVMAGVHNMQFKQITTWLTDASWSKGIKESEVILSACNCAYVVGAFKESVQVAYARVISDKYRYAYILDVIVDPAHRKRGLGRMLIKNILASQELENVYQWTLITGEAHGFYEKLGFNKLTRTNDWYEIRNKRPSGRNI